MPKNPSQAAKNLTIQNKILAIQSEIDSIVKLTYNSFQKYYYFTELQVLNLLKPLLTKHHLTLMLSDDTTQPFCHEKEGNQHLIKYCKKLVISSDDDSLEFNFWACGGNQDLAKAKGAAETYALKYLLSKFFLIPIRDEADPDAHTSEETTSEIKKDIIPPTEPSLEPPAENNKKPVKKEFSPQITATIQKITTKTDKSGNEYLLLRVTNEPNNIFVFSYKVEETNWPTLKVGSTYQFDLEKSEKDILVLTGFGLIKQQNGH